MKCTESGCEGGFVKPDIVFFGEGLPEDYFEALKKIENKGQEKDGGCDLFIVIGTALAVSPFNSCVESVSDGVPKLLWNLGNNTEHGYNFEDLEEFPGRLYMNGKCDDTVWQLCEDLGWTDDFIKTCPDQLSKMRPQKEQKEEN